MLEGRVAGEEGGCIGRVEKRRGWIGGELEEGSGAEGVGSWKGAELDRI